MLVVLSIVIYTVADIHTYICIHAFHAYVGICMYVLHIYMYVHVCIAVLVMILSYLLVECQLLQQIVFNLVRQLLYAVV